MVVPDWVCEVLSPSTAAHVRITKRNLYAHSGISHYWIVDVDAHTLEVFERHDNHCCSSAPTVTVPLRGCPLSRRSSSTWGASFFRRQSERVSLEAGRHGTSFSRDTAEARPAHALRSESLPSGVEAVRDVA